MYFGTSIHGDVGKIAFHQFTTCQGLQTKPLITRPPLYPFFSEKKKKTLRKKTRVFGAVCFYRMVLLLGFFPQKKLQNRVLLHHLSQNLQGVGPLLCFGQSGNNGTITWHLRTRLQAELPTKKKNGFLERFVCKLIQRHQKKKSAKKLRVFVWCCLFFS